MNPFRFLFRTFFWQPVPGWPRVSWRGGGSPENATELLLFAFERYWQAYRASVGVSPPPIVRPVRVTFYQGKSVNSRGDKATMVEGKMSVATDFPDDVIVRLIGEELLHYHRKMLTGDPDRAHEHESFDEVPKMMTDPDHPGWKR